MKILIVKYLPGAANSNTKQLLDAFTSAIYRQKPVQVEELDLLRAQIPVFNEMSIQAYYKRNYGGQPLSEEESKLLLVNDQLIAQLKSADILAIVCPMHNFGFPALVKAYIDAVVFHGETFSYGEKMMAGKKALTLFTSGGVYSNETFNFDYPNWNSIALMSKALFGFMGFDAVEVIGTSLRDEQKRLENLDQASREISELVKKWIN